MFFRSRNQRLDRQAEHATAPAMELPGNLIEASLVELAETDRLFPGAPYAVPRRRESAAGLAVA